jgi:chemotaxis response regulator CheB
MPKMLQEMITSIISSEPRFCIVGKLDAGSDLLSAIRRVGPEVVITQESPRQRDVASGRSPGVQCTVSVVAIDEAGREAALYNLTLHRTPLGDISANGLISAIDRAAGSL